MQIRPEQVLAASLVNPQLGSALSNIYQGQQREKTGTEKEYLKSNLESFKESQQKLPEIRNTNLRLNRLYRYGEKRSGANGQTLGHSRI
jgi:hypothetical protein